MTPTEWTWQTGAPVVAFPGGPEGAHRISNPDGSTARVLVFSTMRFPEIAEYLDTGTLLAMTGPAEGKTFPAGTDAPFLDSVLSAMKAGAERDHDPGRDEDPARDEEPPPPRD